MTHNERAVATFQPGAMQPAVVTAINPTEIVLHRTKPTEKFVRRAAKVLKLAWPIPRNDADAKAIVQALPPCNKIRAMRDPLQSFINGETEITTTRIILSDLTGAMPTATGCSRSAWIAAAMDCLEFDDESATYCGFTPQIVAAAYRKILIDDKPKFLPSPGEFLIIARSCRDLYAHVADNLTFLEQIRNEAEYYLDEYAFDPEWHAIVDRMYASD